MKVLLVNASPRREGNTYRALCEVSRQLEKRGVESEIVQLGVKPVRSCIACNQCLEKELGRCVFDDDMCNRVSEKMAECDGFIIGSPVYYGQPTGAALSLVLAVIAVVRVVRKKKQKKRDKENLPVKSIID